MKKTIILALICTMVFSACKKQQSAAAPEARKSMVSAELQTAFDVYKKINKAQKDYFEKNRTYATAFKQLNIDIPGGKVRECSNVSKNDDYQQCIRTDKYEFYVRGTQNIKYTTYFKSLDGSILMSGYGSPQIKDAPITCAAPDADNGNICEALGGTRDTSMDMANFKAYNIAL